MKDQIGAVAFVVIVVLSAMAYVSPARAGWFDTLTTVVEGHINDITSRTTDDQFVGTENNVLRSGSIRTDDEGQDFLHNASGTVELRYVRGTFYIQLASDFDSTPGPDYHVYISTSSGISNESLFLASEQIELGRLVKGSGASFYEVKGLTPADIKSVTIWCKAFGEFIGSADL